MHYINSLDFAIECDKTDVLAPFRQRFHIPCFDYTQHDKGKEVAYFCGNSLGLQPKTAAKAIEQELNDWAMLGVEGHFKAKQKWFSYHEPFAEPLSKIVGALPAEVAVMNSLSVNLHLLLVSFYRPEKKRFKILFEQNPFSSDRYAMASQAAFHGFDPSEAIVEMQPDENILEKLEELKDELALVMFGGVNYYTGQAFDMKTITETAHKAGALVGFDLAHAAGNIPLELHNWGVDFACWCGYKYLNSGPGSVGGIFVHEKHFYPEVSELPRFAGWWGVDPTVRFKMPEHFQPIKGAQSWALSNDPIFSMAIHKTAIDLFEEAGMEQLHQKSRRLTGFLEFIIDDINNKPNKKGISFKIITPRNPSERGCQLSIKVLSLGKDPGESAGKQLHQAMMNKGIISDWREPEVIRLAPVPLYNNFTDVWQVGAFLKEYVSLD